MFRENSPQKQPNLMDHSFRVPESVREKKLYNDWPGYFFKNIFSNINEERFAVLYSDKYSRPNTPVNVLVGLLILKELNQWTDEDLIGEFYFDYRVQFALGITDIENEGLCENTISNFRSRLYEYAENYGHDLLKEEIEALTEAFIDFTGMDTSLARQDSFMISSNCKEMGRLELIYMVNYNMVKTLSTEDTSLIPECCKHYLEKKDKSTHIYKIKKEEVNDKTKLLLDESLALYEVIPQKLHDTQSFQNLVRLLEEQVETFEDTVVPKDAKDITSDSLQNPSEPDATYRMKGKQQGSGYVMNTVEARDEEKK